MLKSRGMYLAANENFESKELWQPDSQGGHLEKPASLVEADIGRQDDCVAHNLGFNNGQQMDGAGSLAIAALPCFQ